MPTIRNSEQGRRLAQRRWERRRQREAEEAAEAVRLAEAWADDALSFAILTKSEQDRLIGTALRQGAEGALAEVAPAAALVFAEVGVDRATAEWAADLVALFVAEAIQAAGGPKISLPAPEALARNGRLGCSLRPGRAVARCGSDRTRVGGRDGRADRRGLTQPARARPLAALGCVLRGSPLPFCSGEKRKPL